MISRPQTERMGSIVVIDMHPVNNEIRKRKSLGKSNITVKGHRTPEISRRIRRQIPLGHIAFVSNSQAFGKHSIFIDGRPCPHGPIPRQQPQQQGPGQQRGSFSSLMDGSAFGPMVPGNFRDHHPDAPDFAPNDFVDFVHAWKSPSPCKMQKSPFPVLGDQKEAFHKYPDQMTVTDCIVSVFSKAAGAACRNQKKPPELLSVCCISQYIHNF